MAPKATVIGAGPGGYVAAIRAAQRGAEVTVIEEDNVGGTCLNWGCIPSKVMITTAELLEKLRRTQEFGLALHGEVALDMQRLMERKERVIQDQSKGILDIFSHHKVRYLKGKGRIVGPHLATAAMPDGTTVEVPWDKLIIATGTRPFSIPKFPFDGDRILSSNDALSLRRVPESILIVGGGVIGCEFAFLLTALGSKVTVVEALSRVLPLPSVDESCSKVIQREMKKHKIRSILQRTVEEVEVKDDGLLVTIGPSPFVTDLKEKDRQPVTVEVEKVLVCIGRKPNTEDIGLETIGLQPDERGWMIANERMETAVPHVFAIGDVLGPAKIMLAHVATTEGLVAAENAIGGSRTMDYQVVPGAIFTMPEVANVGLTEAQAMEQGIPVRAESVLFRNLGKAQVIGEIAGEAKMVSDALTGKVLGVHIVGPHATDLIGEAALAVRMGHTVTELAETIHAHPTLSEIMLEISFKSLGRAIHG